MDHNVFKQIELTGTSGKSLEDAIESAIARASKTVRNMRWFEVTETRGAIQDGKIAQWQVSLKVGFALEE
jgi:flavin-binding protein dodecin